MKEFSQSVLEDFVYQLIHIGDCTGQRSKILDSHE